MIITAFVSDRHASIAKWMREELPSRCRALGKPVIHHFFELWHIGKKIQKTVIKLSKERGCELIGRWRKACVRHFYWAVTSTQGLLGEVKVAKFHAFLSHALNKHSSLPNRLFNACAHGTITKPKVWFTKGSEAYDKMYDALTNVHLTRAIKKASSVGQTSCLESYHSVINQFAPKMLTYSYRGMLGRTILAAVHFNYNLNREAKIDDNGKHKLKVHYPKYKYGEASVKECKIPQNFDYIGELYTTMTTTPRDELKTIEEELRQQTPESMHNMFEKEPVTEAIKKYTERKQKVATIYPPTCSDAEVQRMMEQASTCVENVQDQIRRAPSCRRCGAPMRGHKRGSCGATTN